MVDVPATGSIDDVLSPLFLFSYNKVQQTPIQAS